MRGQRLRLAVETLAARRFPGQAVVYCVMQSRPAHAGIGGRIPDVNRVGIPSGGEQMKVAFALQPQLVPRLGTVAAAQKTERVHEPRARRRMAAAIDVISGRGEPHVVVLGPGRLGPFAVLVDRKAVVARAHQPLAVHAVREAVHVHEHDRTLRRRNCRYANQNQSKKSHFVLAFRVISARAPSTSRVVQWLLMYASAAQISASESLPPKAGMSLSSFGGS